MICEKAGPLSELLYNPTAFYMQLLHVRFPDFYIAYVELSTNCEHDLSFFPLLSLS